MPETQQTKVEESLWSSLTFPSTQKAKTNKFNINVGINLNLGCVYSGSSCRYSYKFKDIFLILFNSAKYVLPIISDGMRVLRSFEGSSDAAS